MSAVAAPPPPQIGDSERLGATVVLSMIVHGLLVLGLGFALDDAAPVLPTLDVILTQVQTPLTPAQADFLAQANNQGGGEHDKSSRPSEPQIGIADRPTPGVATQPLRRQNPAPQPPPETRVITALRSEANTPHALDTPPPVDPTDPTGRAKIDRDMEMARRAAEIQLRSEAYAKRPKRKFVSASTKEYAYAGYMRQWVDRVQRVGNLNYPDEARRRRIGGLLVISVAIRRDGSVEKMVIVESSHIPMLDDAALRIVKLAEPYAPLPKTKEEIDILHVTRTWQFMPGGELIDR
jgi:protein TonB